MRIRILPYKQGSKSAKVLATELGGKVLKLEGSKFKYQYGDVVINWGKNDCSDIVDKITRHLDYPDNTTILNWMPHLIQRASNKLQFFQLMKEKCPDVIPDFWTDKDAIPSDVFPVVCRTVLNGHSGNGIVIADSVGALVNAPLYVRYVKKSEEYRVHIGKKGEEYTTIAIQRKARKLDVPDEEVNWQIRNLDGGFIFQREGFTAPSAVEEAARNCLRETGLDFGAVDVIWNEAKEKAYVLEVNTAPGLEGQTIKDYGDFFRGCL